MLPDCFGFPAALPTILHHCGIKGFFYIFKYKLDLPEATYESASIVLPDDNRIHVFAVTMTTGGGYIRAAQSFYDDLEFPILGNYNAYFDRDEK